MWHYINNNTQHGPVETATIPQLITHGIVTADTLVWRDGLAEWTAASQTELGGYFPAATHQAALGTPDLAPATATAPAPMGWKQILWSFEGRIPRRTFWAGSLIWMAATIVAVLAMGAAANALENPAAFMVPFALFFIVQMWSTIALQVKRWHDRGKSGAWFLINLIPYIGGLWAFIECGCLRGSYGRNPYGDDPT